MALLDIFKKKKKEKKISRKERIEKKEKVVSKKTKEKKEEIKVETPRPRKTFPEMAYRVLSSPNITEKATNLTKENKYIFKVKTRTNKTEVRKIIEDIYGVNVVGVKIINIPAKKRTIRRQVGWKKGYKKAIVKIKEGQKIEVLPR